MDDCDCFVSSVNCTLGFLVSCLYTITANFVLTITFWKCSFLMHHLACTPADNQLRLQSSVSVTKNKKFPVLLKKCFNECFNPVFLAKLSCVSLCKDDRAFCNSATIGHTYGSHQATATCTVWTEYQHMYTVLYFEPKYRGRTLYSIKQFVRIIIVNWSCQ